MKLVESSSTSPCFFSSRLLVEYLLLVKYKLLVEDSKISIYTTQIRNSEDRATKGNVKKVEFNRQPVSSNLNSLSVEISKILGKRKIGINPITKSDEFPL